MRGRAEIDRLKDSNWVEEGMNREGVLYCIDSENEWLIDWMILVNNLLEIMSQG